MTTLTAEERGDMVEEILPVAAHLAVLVHGDGGPEDVQQALAGLSEAQRTALIVVLAGLVDPDQPMGSALGWLDFDETGTLTVPSWDDASRVRDMAAGADIGDPDEYVDEVAVANYVKGKAVRLSKPERLAAVALAAKKGVTYIDLDVMHGLKKGDTATFVSRMRRRYAMDGIPFPVVSTAASSRRFTEAEVIAIRERSARGATDLEIGMSFGAQDTTIAHICRGERYAEFGGPIRAKRGVTPGKASRDHMCGHSGGSLAARTGSLGPANAKLTPQQRHEISVRTTAGEDTRELASEYGVHRSTVYRYAG